MKVAILIPGQARFVRNNDTILKLSEQYNADIYIHTWNVNQKKTYFSPYCVVMGEYSIHSEDIVDYISLYNPKKFQVEEELSEDFIDNHLIKRDITERTSDRVMKYNMYRYFYSLNKCFELSKVDNYDVFIITRSDMLIHNLPVLNTEYIIAPKIHNHNSSLYSYYIDSMLLCVPSIYIEKYLNIINKMDEYYDMGYHYCFDHIFYAHLNESKLIQNTLNFSTNEFYFEIKRNEEGTLLHKLW
jgi:hypothetical protein